MTGSAPVGGGNAALFAAGDFTATGTKAFLIDDPRDPTNRDLYHYCAEGPEPLLEYGGNARLNANGETWVNLPGYWSLINRDPRYHLTPIGAAMPDLHVASRVSGDRFRIAGGAPNGEVSWRVSGVRNDARVKLSPLPVEAMKPAEMRGYYRMPEAYGQGPQMGEQGARRAAILRREGAGAVVEP